MKSFTVLSFLASLVPLALAQANTTANSLIPSDISSTCQAFYVQLNANAALTSCLKPLISSTSAFSAGSNPTTISPSIISSSLDSICSSANTCDATLINTQLGLFLKACQTELTSTKTADVILTYDVMYTFGLLQESLCQKDDSGKYCALSMTSSQSTTKRSSSLGRRDSQVAIVPNVDKYSKENIAFLGMQPTNMTADQLCTSCTRKIMNLYTSQLNTVPYGPGISFTVLLSGQPALYAAINSKCGASFLSGQVQAAGALQTGAAPRAADSAFALVGSAIVAVAAGAIAVL
ncbi:hypothetical protein EDB84DRAFT_1577938 [Lactarius hengduanensis]|nr:hypothetical protein EDB84DRAFT_1577938 [Lactarius hengduanensis]